MNVHAGESCHNSTSIYPVLFLLLNCIGDYIYYLFIEMEEDENVGDKNGFFKTYHLKVLESLKNTDLEQLKSCSNDEQRFAFCHSLPYVHQHQPKVLRRLFKPKSSIHAGQRRIEGNKAFLIKNYLQALQLYSSAILKASLYEGIDS